MINEWIDRLALWLTQNSDCVLVTVMSVIGSAPREVGASMVVRLTNDPQQTIESVGSIGGGHLEWQSLNIAQSMLSNQSEPSLIMERFNLGARLGQCCGGRVLVLFERISHLDIDFFNNLLYQTQHGQTLYRYLSSSDKHSTWQIKKAIEIEQSKTSYEIMHQDGSCLNKRRYAGYVNWNGLVEIDESIAPADQWTTFVGEGKRVSLMPIAGGRFYFFFDVPLPVGLPNERYNYKTLLKQYFTGWCEPVQKLIDKIDPAKTNRVEIHDIEPFDTWVKGRVVLLGDSAHGTTPDIGQGGCQALEDSIYLTRSLAINTNSIDDALKRYVEVRAPRANHLVMVARKRCGVTHGEDPAATQAWYDELRQEDGKRILQGILNNIQGNPLD